MKKLIGFICVLFLLVGCGTDDYRKEIEITAKDILKTSEVIRDSVKMYYDVWNFSIGSSTAYSVEEFSIGANIDESIIREHFNLNSIGNVPGDFSTNIHSTKEYLENVGELEKIKNEVDAIKEKMKSLKDAPKGFKKAHDELLDMYSALEEYKEMAIDPSGDFNTYSKKMEELPAEITDKQKRIEVVIP